MKNRTPEEERALRSKQNHNAYIKRQAKGGHKRTISIRMPDELIGWVTRTITDGRMNGTRPWRTMSECICDCVVKQLKQLPDVGEDVREMQELYEVSERLEKIETVQKAQLAILSRGRTQISEFIRIGAVDEAGDLYRTLMRAIMRTSPSVWREHVIKELHAEFPDLEKRRPDRPLFDSGIKGNGQAGASVHKIRLHKH